MYWKVVPKIFIFELPVWLLMSMDGFDKVSSSGREEYVNGRILEEVGESLEPDETISRSMRKGELELEHWYRKIPPSTSQSPMRKNLSVNLKLDRTT